MEDTYTPPFVAGDVVGWSHQISTKHARGSILRRAAFEAEAHGGVEVNDPGTGQIGVVVTEAGRNLFDVDFGDDQVRTLTSDELVKLQED